MNDRPSTADRDASDPARDDPQAGLRRDLVWLGLTFVALVAVAVTVDPLIDAYFPGSPASQHLVDDAAIIGVALSIGLGAMVVRYQADLRRQAREREEIEDELARTARSLDALTEHSPDFILTCDREGRITWVNRTAPGVDRENVVGGPMIEWVHPARRSEFEARLRRVLDHGAVETFEGRTELPEGTRIHDTTIAPIAGDDGIRGAVLVARDVTERREAETRLEEQRDLHRNLLAALAEMGHGIVMFDLDDWKVTWANDRFYETMDRSPSYLDSLPDITSVVLEEDRDELVENMMAFSADDPIQHTRYRIPDRHGNIRWIEAVGSLLTGSSDDRFVAILRDVTQEAEAEETLEESRRRLLRAQEVTQVGDWSWDVAEDRVTWSPKLHELWGIDPDEGEMTYERILEAVHPDDRARFQEVVERAMEEGTYETFQHRIVRPDGTVRWMEARGEVQRDPDGQVVKLSGTAQDITERVEARREVERERDMRAALFEGNVDPIMAFEIDEGGDAIFRGVNPRFREVFGFTEETLEGRPLKDVLVPEEGMAEHEEFVRRIRQGEPVEGEVERITTEGPRLFRAQAIPIDLGDGKTGGYAWYTDLTAFRRLEEEETFKAHLLDQVGQAVNAVDADGTITYWNEHAEELFGYSKEEALGEKIYELIGAHREHVEEIRDHMERGEAWKGEMRVERRDGSTFPAVFTKEPLLDEDGNLEGVIGISYDITDLRKLEQEEAFKAQMLDEVGQAVIVTDAKGRITYWNAHAESMYGWTAEEALGEEIMELNVPDTAEGQAAAQEIMASLSGGEQWEGEFSVQRKDGSTFPAWVSNAPVTDDEGNLESVIGISYDITDLRELEQEEALKARMLDQVGQSVVAVDPEMRVIYWNPHAEELHGYTADEAIGRRIDDLVQPEGESWQDEIEARIREGEGWSGEVPFARKDGTTFPAMASVSPVFGGDGAMQGVIGTSVDLSDIKETQRRLVRTTNQLRARNRELQELSHATAHEFQSPIRDIVRFLQLLEKEAADRLTAEDFEHLGFALGGARKIDELVDAIQEYLDAATRPAEAGPCDVEKMLHGVLDDLDVDAADATVTWDDDLPLVGVGAESMKAIFRHLLENAIAFRGDDPARVHVAADRQDKMWVLAVRDEGVGIDPKHHERIFRPFRTLHGPDEGAGPGLGLALCRGIVEAYGGAIWVQSKEGAGATFYATVPPVDAIPPLSPEEAATGPGDDGSTESPDDVVPDLWEE